MKFIFFQPTYHPNQHPIVKGLQRRGHDVKYVTQNTHTAANYTSLEPINIGYSRSLRFVAKIFNKDNPDIWKKFVSPPVHKLWKEISNYKPDIVIVRDYTLPSALALLFGNLHGATGVVQQLNPMCGDKNQHVKSKIGDVYRTTFREPLIRITPIEGNCKENPPPENVYHIPHPVDVEMYEQKQSGEYFKNNQINLINVGRLGAERKKTRELLQVFKHIQSNRSAHLTLVGTLSDSEDPYYQRLLSFIDENNLEENVNILINMDHGKLQEMYSEYDLFVFPAVNEPLGMAGLEALAAGLPVICTDDSGVGTYVKDGWNGYVISAGSEIELLEAIKKFTANKEKIVEMGQNAKTEIMENHLPEQYAKKLEIVLRENFDV